MTYPLRDGPGTIIKNLTWKNPVSSDINVIFLQLVTSVFSTCMAESPTNYCVQRKLDSPILENSVRPLGRTKNKEHRDFIKTLILFRALA